MSVPLRGSLAELLRRHPCLVQYIPLFDAKGLSSASALSEDVVDSVVDLLGHRRAIKRLLSLHFQGYALQRPRPHQAPPQGLTSGHLITRATVREEQDTRRARLNSATGDLLLLHNFLGIRVATFEDLSFPDCPVATHSAWVMSSLLKTFGFQVQISHENPSKAGILTGMKAFASRSLPTSVFCVYLCTCVTVVNDTTYLVPADGRPGDPATLLSLEEIQRALQHGRGQSVVILDIQGSYTTPLRGQAQPSVAVLVPEIECFEPNSSAPGYFPSAFGQALLALSRRRSATATLWDVVLELPSHLAACRLRLYGDRDACASIPFLQLQRQSVEETRFAFRVELTIPISYPKLSNEDLVGHLNCIRGGGTSKSRGKGSPQDQWQLRVRKPTSVWTMVLEDLPDAPLRLATMEQLSGMLSSGLGTEVQVESAEAGQEADSVVLTVAGPFLALGNAQAAFISQRRVQGHRLLQAPLLRGTSYAVRVEADIKTFLDFESCFHSQGRVDSPWQTPSGMVVRTLTLSSCSPPMRPSDLPPGTWEVPEQYIPRKRPFSSAISRSNPSFPSSPVANGVDDERPQQRTRQQSPNRSPVAVQLPTSLSLGPSPVSFRQPPGVVNHQTSPTTVPTEDIPLVNQLDSQGPGSPPAEGQLKGHPEEPETVHVKPEEQQDNDDAKLLAQLEEDVARVEEERSASSKPVTAVADSLPSSAVPGKGAEPGDVASQPALPELLATVCSVDAAGLLVAMERIGSALRTSTTTDAGVAVGDWMRLLRRSDPQDHERRLRLWRVLGLLVEAAPQQVTTVLQRQLPVLLKQFLPITAEGCALLSSWAPPEGGAGPGLWSPAVWSSVEDLHVYIQAMHFLRSQASAEAQPVATVLAKFEQLATAAAPLERCQQKLCEAVQEFLRLSEGQQRWLAWQVFDRLSATHPWAAQRLGQQLDAALFHYRVEGPEFEAMVRTWGDKGQFPAQCRIIDQYLERWTNTELPHF